MPKTRGGILFLTLLATLGIMAQAYPRSYIQGAGSSAIYPFAIAVAENFHLKTELPTPVIESTGTGGGIKIFCSGVGEKTLDVVFASRPLTPRERHYCHHQGVQEILEIVLGFDGIVVATSSTSSFNPPFLLTRRHLQHALASQLQGRPNPNFLWSEVASPFPSRKIKFLGPSSASGTREAFTQLIQVSSLRQDGIYADASDQENVIIQKLQLEPEALGIFSFSFLKHNRDKLTPFPIEGVLPSFESILSRRYPLSRRLYLYVKGEHLRFIKGLGLFLREFISREAAGTQGYLSFYGFIPQREEDRFQEEKKVLRFLKKQEGTAP